MNNKPTPKRKVGRPKGATSFVRVDISTLQEHVGRKQTIPVSRVWLEENNINVSPKPISDTIFNHIKY
jgi:hypothetical protein